MEEKVLEELFSQRYNALSYFYNETLNVSPPILSAAIYRNENIDRPEKDWAMDKRAKSKFKFLVIYSLH